MGSENFKVGEQEVLGVGGAGGMLREATEVLHPLSHTLPYVSLPVGHSSVVSFIINQEQTKAKPFPEFCELF